jgi:hypothetical protein
MPILIIVTSLRCSSQSTTLEVTPREVKEHKEKHKKLKTTKKKTINNTTKKEGGFDSPKATLRERSKTEVGSRT